ncbi:hypothetical protein ACOMICROBIO_GDFFDHBD_03897 [Vibrio sp. B1REV9]|nr:hypothetical protein ACOMICROBIO_GDFFDHBD_03897 [Vibrio sp. B1REV9]
MVAEDRLGGEKIIDKKNRQIKKTPLKLSGGESCQHYY